ncbi:hypothetical protein [Dyella silvatica]|uniref:hypothetical protein n=1 Tax=Dyella silvatica TaxID=2992128 RepID=UPI00224FCFF1|nr:hypothetical protein [Dyella silvatica]
MFRKVVISSLLFCIAMTQVSSLFAQATATLNNQPQQVEPTYQAAAAAPGSTKAVTATYEYTCRGCTAAQLDAQFRAWLPTMAPGGAYYNNFPKDYSGQYYASDIPSGLIFLYNVSLSNGISVTPIQVDAPAAAMLGAMHYYYVNRPGQWGSIVDAYVDANGNITRIVAPDGSAAPSNTPAAMFHVPINDINGGCPSPSKPGATDDGKPNAWETVNVPAIGLQIKNQLDVQSAQLIGPYVLQSMMAAIKTILQSSPLTPFRTPDWMTGITFHFHDGSSRKYTYDYNTRGYFPIPNTAVDCTGNVIPENKRAFAGVAPSETAYFYYTYYSIDYLNFVNSATSYGLIQGGTVFMPGARPLVCVLKGEGLGEVCTVQ